MITYQELYKQLQPLYDEGEAKAIVRLLVEDAFQLSFTDVVSGRLATLSEEDRQRLDALMARLRHGEPVQYVIGEALFMGRRYEVTPDTLIPRPETAQLCQLLMERYNRSYCALQPPAPLRVLDVGTGSGCIAVTLALDLWNSTVSAWDISGEALLVARRNALRLGAKVNLEQHDVLHPDALMTRPEAYDIIVSNPPYICENERAAMSPHVLDHEPATALFVPNEEPLLFYHAIARLAAATLSSEGCLAFEINPLYAAPLADWLKAHDWQHVEIFDDQFGKQRFIISWKK